MRYDVLHHMQYLLEYMYCILLLLFYFGFMFSLFVVYYLVFSGIDLIQSLLF